MTNEGKFEREDLQGIVNKSTMAFGNDFDMMNAEDKQHYLDKLGAKEEFARIKQKLAQVTSLQSE